jgi:hypothetical protein
VERALISDAELTASLVRCDQVERLLLAAEGISETMCLCRELRETQRSLSGQRRATAALARVVNVRRQIELVIGAFAVSMAKRGLLCTGSANQRTLPTRATFGVSTECWTNWRQRARTLIEAPFPVRVTEASTVADAKAVRSEACNDERRAIKDDRALALCRAMKIAAMRRGGKLGADVPLNWTRAAKLPDDEYRNLVAAGLGLPKPVPLKPRKPVAAAGSFLPGIRMTISPWQVEGPDGVMTRTISNAADAAPAQ